MSPWRLVVAHAVIVTLIAGAAIDVVAQRDDWPFSSYTMFAEAQRGSVHGTVRLYAIDDAGDETLLYGEDSLWPFDESRLRTALGRLWERGDATAMTAALTDVARRYERRRREGRHDGPVLP